MDNGLVHVVPFFYIGNCSQFKSLLYAVSPIIMDSQLSISDIDQEVIKIFRLLTDEAVLHSLATPQPSILL